MLLPVVWRTDGSVSIEAQLLVGNKITSASLSATYHHTTNRGPCQASAQVLLQSRHDVVAAVSL